MSDNEEKSQPSTSTHIGLPTEIWEKKLKENEKTAFFDKESFVASSSKEKKDKKYALNIWAALLLVMFTLSALCGLFLTLKPIVPQEQEITKEEENSTLTTLTSSNKTGVAWIKIYGVIAQEGDSGPFSRQQGASSIAKKIREAGKDKNVKAIVLDINSPGGTVASVQNIYSEILKAKENKKVVALFRDVAASGGFYVAMAADKIIAEPGTITGSVGVIMQTSNLEGLFNKIGVKMVPITSGKYKDIGSAYRPMSDEEKALLQDMVNDTYSQFFAAVKAGRPQVKEDVLREYTDGRIFTGQRAYNLGFIDQLGGEDDALKLAGELAGLENPKILSTKSDNLKEFIFSFGSSLDNKAFVKQIQSLATPSVSYLWIE